MVDPTQFTGEQLAAPMQALENFGYRLAEERHTAGSAVLDLVNVSGLLGNMREGVGSHGFDYAAVGARVLDSLEERSHQRIDRGSNDFRLLVRLMTRGLVFRDYSHLDVLPGDLERCAANESAQYIWSMARGIAISGYSQTGTAGILRQEFRYMRRIVAPLHPIPDMDTHRLVEATLDETGVANWQTRTRRRTEGVQSVAREAASATLKGLRTATVDYLGH